MKLVFDKVCESFRKALFEMREEIEAGRKGNGSAPVRPTHVAYRAYGIYREELGEEGSCPNRRTFKTLVCSGDKSNTVLMAMLKQAGIEKALSPIDTKRGVIRPRRLSQNEAPEIFNALRAAATEGNERGKLGLRGIIKKGFEVYRRDSEDREGTPFREFKRYSEELIVSRLFVLKRSKSMRLDREKLIDVFQRALAILKAERPVGGRLIKPQTVANLAHEIYCKLWNGQKMPRVGTFRNLVSGKSADENLSRLLRQSGAVATKDL